MTSRERDASETRYCESVKEKAPDYSTRSDVKGDERPDGTSAAARVTEHAVFRLTAERRRETH